jgi:hypothetical protein
MSAGFATLPTTHTYESGVRCDMCGSTRATPFGPHPAEAAEKLRQNWNCTFVRCDDCGLQFYSPRLTEDYAVKTFLEGQDAELEANNMADLGVFFGEPQGSPQEQIESLRVYYTQIFEGLCERFMAIHGRLPTSMFEVGTSVGWFAKAAREYITGKGLPFDFAGCDANVFSARNGRTRFGLDIQGSTFSKYEVSPGQLGHYDMIVGLDTLRGVIERAGWQVVVYDDKTEWVYSQFSVIAQNPG